MESPASGAREIAVCDHAGSVMGPVCPAALVAFAPAKLTAPKSARGSV
jgi:hypothetical protein